jgi:hypothetical protein
MRLARSLFVLSGVALATGTAHAQSADDDAQQQPSPPPTSTPPIVANPQAPPPKRSFNPSSNDASPVGEGQWVYDGWRSPLFLAGGLTFGAAYIGSVIGAATSSHPGANNLYIPFAGPWLAFNDWRACPRTTTVCSTNNSGEKALLVVDGVAQAAGVIAMIDALLTPRRHLFATTAVNDKKLHLMPTDTGMMVFAHF